MGMMEAELSKFKPLGGLSCTLSMGELRRRLTGTVFSTRAKTNSFLFDDHKFEASLLSVCEDFAGYIQGHYYLGQCKKGTQVLEGRGTRINKTGGIYEGYWLNNKMHNKGRYIWPDGGMYEGNFDQNKRHGKGVHLFADGKKYEGEWYCDKREGHGVMTYLDGSYYEGYWKDHLEKGKGSFTDKTGRQYITIDG